VQVRGWLEDVGLTVGGGGCQVSRPPLFFKETNLQLRKHTLWQATTGFTGGQASICK
jgi:hypothetical protein